MPAYARINEYGFAEAPYRRIDKETGIVTDEVEYMTADVEDRVHCGPGRRAHWTADGRLLNARVTCRHRDEIIEVRS